MNNIIFPGLGLDFKINPVAFTIASKEIYWYGIIIAMGFLLATLYAVKRSKTFGLTSDDVIDCILIAAPIGIIFARIYYVIFSFDIYKNNIIDIFKIWEGGIAIYGGIIGGILGIYLFSKWKKLSFLSILDLGACSILLGQAIGRWGNFVNAEAFGSVTTSLFRMTINAPSVVDVGFHPTFLYESVVNLIGFILLYFISKHFYKFKGQMALIYVIWYGFFRGIIEGLREDSLYIGTIRVSQALGFTSALIGIAILVILITKKKKNSNIIAENDTDILTNEINTQQNEDD